ncbi:ABC transporter permease [Methanospirillum lacunae]|uniref:ABC transporter permease n=1 Tax=Methanospirillum lacunae TaxID=668570 RepID=A0A2V2N1L5_9EURY|nr:ABC transporter permease [Methanospirillum lacunae]PWR70017.1 ABC transporter permease [Methanospirillum lacunae]
MAHKHKISRGLLLPVMIFIIWEILSKSIGNSFILPGWELIIPVLIHPMESLFGGASLLENAIVSLQRVIIGFLLAVMCAVPLGLLSGWSQKIDDYINPLIQVLRPVPPIAWMPLAIAWFEIGFGSLIFIIFIGSFFPVLISTIEGVHTIRGRWLEVAQTLGATTGETFLTVVIPGALPFIWTGLRLAFGVSWMCLVAAEMLPGTSAGLGYLIMYAYNLGQIQVIVAGMIVIGTIGIISDYIFKLGQLRFFGWQGKE